MVVSCSSSEAQLGGPRLTLRCTGREPATRHVARFILRSARVRAGELESVRPRMIENREAATKILAAAFEASRILDESIHTVLAVGNADEITTYKRAVAGVMGEILFRILNPVIHEHPDLAPKNWKNRGAV